MPTTINELFQDSVRRFGDRPAIARKVGVSFEAVTYAELAERVRELAGGLAALGLERGDGVGLIAENGLEWAVVDLAMLSLGAVNVPMFTTLPSSASPTGTRNR